MSKRKKIIVLFCVAAIIFFLPLIYIRQHYAVPIIMYHSVNPNAQPKNRLAVTDQTFARQMHFLKRHHYNVIPLEELGFLIREKKKIPPKTIVISFDDGNKDNYTYAFPVLKKYNLPAAVFMIIQEIGRNVGDKLNWEEIKEMQDSGLVTFGSHCIGPEPLINIKSEDVIRREIFDSKKILELNLNTKVNIFSYPEGRFNARIKQLVQEAGYQVAVATNPGRGFPNDDIFALKRLRISANSDNLLIFWVETSGYYNFMREWKRK